MAGELYCERPTDRQTRIEYGRRERIEARQQSDWTDRVGASELELAAHMRIANRWPHSEACIIRMQMLMQMQMRMRIHPLRERRRRSVAAGGVYADFHRRPFGRNRFYALGARLSLLKLPECTKPLQHLPVATV